MVRGRTSRGRLASADRRHRWLPTVASLLTLALVAVGCAVDSTEPAPGDPAPTTPSASIDRPVVTLGVYGPPDELTAWAEVVEAYNQTSVTSQARLITWPDHDVAIEALTSATRPDVFLVSRRSLDELVDNQFVQPVGELLDERDVDFGDGFERSALLAFGRDNALQCMPYATSPQVLFYNTELIDFERMLARGLAVPEFEEDLPRTWNFAQFRTAVEFAARPARNIRGFYFEPTLSGLAPLLYAAEAPIFDDETEPPTSTALASEDGVAALEAVLPVLRRTRLTLSSEQLQRATPLEWFRRGKLGVIAGDHSLVPLLRRTPGLAWDVLPFPVLTTPATTGDITGLCMSADAEAADAADLIVHAISAESVAKVAAAGYVVPTNLEVSESEAFLSAGPPPNARVFNDSIRRLQLDARLYITPELEQVARPLILAMLNETLPDIPALAAQIDAGSQEVLSPPATPSPSPSPSPSP